MLDDFDVALVQHEYGIFGGPDGEDVLELVALLHVPVITVLHTVLTHPTPHQHSVLAALVRGAPTRSITMTETARGRLVAGWGIDPARIQVITHGAVHNIPLVPKPAHVPADAGDRPHVGPARDGKGIEWALRALAGLADVVARPAVPHRRADPPARARARGRGLPRPAGRPDPRARPRRLRALRRRVPRRATGCGAIVREADVILLPYDSQEQVTSGVLIEAVAAGKPVVSTAFPHAVELLSSGAGLLVPQRDPEALSPRAAAGAHRARSRREHGRRVAPDRAVAALAGRGHRVRRPRPVADRRRRPVRRLMPSPLRFDHLLHLAARVGRLRARARSPSPGPSTATASTTWRACWW